MHTPLVSIIIPTYNGAVFLGKTIESVLKQTYSTFELMIVDDASPDHTAEVIKQYDDPRLNYIVHAENQGADRARHTALQAASGEIIAFLDQDDLFHPEKLQAHVSFLESHPEIGFTYNARFELDYSAETIRDIWRPPSEISLADLVLWFPIAPSDAVVRREWALQMDLIGGSRGAEILHFGHLFMAGCKFAYIDRALNYRRYHSGRTINNLSRACESELKNQVRIFSDPRCPSKVRALRNIAHANIYMYWAYLAYAQDETTLARDYVREAVRLKPAITKGMPCEFVNNFLINCIDDENQDHEALLQHIFAQLPLEFSHHSEHYKWAVAQGYLRKGARAVMWQRPADGKKYFEHAVRIGAQVDESFLQTLTDKLLNYEAVFGDETAQIVLQRLAPYFDKLGNRASMRRLKGSYAINRAFRNYRSRAYARVPIPVLQALVSDPKYLTNRGVLSLLLRSTVARWRYTTNCVKFVSL